MKKFIAYLLILMGLSCFTAQVLFIREFLIVFNGNELTIGLILANWLILASLGSFIFGKVCQKLRSPILWYATIQLIIGILFPLCVFAARVIKIMLAASPGEGLGLWPIFFSSLFIMSFLGLLLGGQFPLGCRIYQDFRRKTLAQTVGKSYFWEAVGFGLGGVIVTYFLIPHLNSLQIAFLLGWINILCASFLFALAKNKKIKILTICICLALGFWIFTSGIDDFHKLSLNWQWKNLNLVDYQNSIYGNLTVTKQKEQFAFFYDGIPFMSIPTPDVVFTEDMVNFPLGGATSCEKILVIGSGLGGIINNILKFPIKNIDYVELDPLVIEMAKRYQTSLTARELNDRHLRIHYLDGRLFLKNTREKFDVIIMNLPGPSTLQLNRFYTQEFFKLIKQHLKENGVFSFALPGSLSYLSGEQIDLNRCIFETLKTVFPATDVIVGYYNLYLASLKENFQVSPTQVADGLKKNKIQSALFTNFYLQDRLNTANKQWFIAALKQRSVRLNKDFEPAGVFYSLSLWNALFTPGFQKIFKFAIRLNMSIYIGIILSFLILFLWLMWFYQKKRLSLFLNRTPVLLLVLISGFSGISLNLVLVFCLQTFSGYVYLYLGLLISIFMLGLTSGSLLMSKRLGKINKPWIVLLRIDGLFIIFCLLFSYLLSSLQVLVAKNVDSRITLLLLSCLSFWAGFFVGFEFPLSNKIYLEKGTGKKIPSNILYAVDTLGSFLGVISVSIFLIPIVGIVNTIFLIFFIKFCVFILLATSFFFVAESHL